MGSKPLFRNRAGVACFPQRRGLGASGLVSTKLFMLESGRYASPNRVQDDWLKSFCDGTLAHAFSDTALRDIEYCVSANVDVFCHRLVSEDARQNGSWGEPKNMSSVTNYLTFDNLSFAWGVAHLGCSPETFTVTLWNCFSTMHGDV